jgi:rod shape-determining protein MreB
LDMNEQSIEDEDAPASNVSDRSVSDKKRLPIGLDLGTLESCILSKLSKPGSDQHHGVLVPTVVGYPEEGILAGILPGNSEMLHGHDAIANQLHLRLVNPLSDGVVQDLEATKSFLGYLRAQVDPEFKGDALCVIGIPGVADEDAKHKLQEAAKSVFDGVLLIPEPFLAALGMRDEERLQEDGYKDPVSNSLFVDIGAGTTDFCIIQGYFPKPQDLLSIPFGGNEVDVILDQLIRESYPEVNLPISMIRGFKEEFSYVGEPESGVRVKVPVEGKPRKIEIGKQVGEACNRLVDEITESLKQVIASASPQSVFSLLQNIILTGGGSRIRNIDQEIQQRLIDEGFENPDVRLSEKDYSPLVAIGALKVAKAAREDQWLR